MFTFCLMSFSYTIVMHHKYCVYFLGTNFLVALIVPLSGGEMEDVRYIG